MVSQKEYFSSPLTLHGLIQTMAANMVTVWWATFCRGTDGSQGTLVELREDRPLTLNKGENITEG